MSRTKIITINQIIKQLDGIIKIYPSQYENIQFEYIYRTASGINWNKNENCFIQYEPIRWKDDEFIINTILSVKTEYGIQLIIDEITTIKNISEIVVNALMLNYYKMVILGNDNYEFVYVNNDGTVREVSLPERIYLQTKYSGGDGDRPYIKNNYKQKTPDKKLHGYCYRKKIPKNIKIKKSEDFEQYVNLKEELKRVQNMNYEIDYKGINFLKILESV